MSQEAIDLCGEQSSGTGFKEFLPKRKIEQLILALECLREGGLLSEVSILRTLE